MRSLIAALLIGSASLAHAQMCDYMDMGDGDGTMACLPAPPSLAEQELQFTRGCIQRAMQRNAPYTAALERFCAGEAHKWVMTH